MTTTAVRNVNDYLDALPLERQEALAAVRSLIKQIWPGIVEDMAYGMPTYHLDGHALCALASQKHFMALYIMPYDLLLPFKNDLKVHDCGKSCIRFKRMEPFILDLFDRIIKYTGSQMSMSRYFGKADNLRVNGKSR